MTTARTKVIYLNRIAPENRLPAILAVRDQHFNRNKVPMHRSRWVRASVRGGYWTT